MFPGHVLLLAKEWLPEALLTKPAATYLAAVLEYVAAEVLELGGNAARDNMSVVVVPFYLMLAVEYDADLAPVFRGTIFRDSALCPPEMHPIFTLALTPGAYPNQAYEGDDYDDDYYDEYHEAVSYDHVFRRTFSGCDGYYDGEELFTAADARNGYLYSSVERNVFMPTADNLFTVRTRRQRQLEVIENLHGRDRDLLAAEFPVSSSRADLMKLSPTNFRSSLFKGIRTEAQIELCCIDRSAVQQLIRVHAPSMLFTHEAMNVLILALQHYLLTVLRTATYSTPMMQCGIVKPAHVTNARRILDVMQAAGDGNLVSLENLIVQQQFDINMICKNETALTAACDAGQLETLRWLVAHGAAVDLDLRAGKMPPLTAIVAAAMKPKVNADVVRLLLDLGANMNSRGGDIEGTTLLMHLCKSGDAHVELIQELIARGVSINDRTVGSDALHVAVEARQYATAEALVFGGIDVTAQAFDTTAVDRIRDPQVKERLLRAIQQMEEPGLK
jgi:ankyrin repeat protein